MTASPTLSITFPTYAGIAKIGTIAALRNILSNTIADGDNMLVDGLLNVGDGDGGVFVYDAASLTTDDGETSIAPIDVGALAGRWLKVETSLDLTAPNASAVLYGSYGFANIREALDSLLYVAPAITNFTASPAIVELGSTIGVVALAWTLNKTVTSQAISGLSALTPDERTVSPIGTFTSDQSWTLTASDGQTNVSATATLAFQQQLYYGVSTATTLTNDAILAFSSEFATSVPPTLVYDCSVGLTDIEQGPDSFTEGWGLDWGNDWSGGVVTPTSGNYPYLVYPSAWGTPTATIGGFGFTDFVVTQQEVTNASGYVSAYNVVRFNNFQTNSAIPVVWSIPSVNYTPPQLSN